MGFGAGGRLGLRERVSVRMPERAQPGAHAEGDAGAERELDLQLGLEKEMTLAQLLDVLETEAVVASASKGKRPVPRARKGRGRKAAR